MHGYVRREEALTAGHSHLPVVALAKRRLGREIVFALSDPAMRFRYYALASRVISGFDWSRLPEDISAQVVGEGRHTNFGAPRPGNADGPHEQRHQHFLMGKDGSTLARILERAALAFCRGMMNVLPGVFLNWILEVSRAFQNCHSFLCEQYAVSAHILEMVMVRSRSFVICLPSDGHYRSTKAQTTFATVKASRWPPDRDLIWRRVARIEREEEVKGAPVHDLELHLLIRQTIERLQNKHLEHYHRVHRLLATPKKSDLSSPASGSGRNISN